MRKLFFHLSAASALTASALAGDVVAVKAGTIHPGGGAPAIDDGVVVAEDGRIVALGAADQIAVPAGADVIDYGAGAVIAPGFVAADSAFVSTTPGPRTADPSLLAIDQFDPYSSFVSALQAGITTMYLPPARGRLIAGQGAVVKAGGERAGDVASRVLRESAGLHGSISREARSTPGYWEPPVPATVDVGLGVEAPQLPKTTMGAILALEELFAFAGGDESFAAEYGPLTGPALKKAVDAGATWRMGAETPGEVRAILDASKRFGFPLVVDGAGRAATMAEDLAAAGVAVIARPHYKGAANFGKAETSDWPTYDSIARLAGEGVRVAIASPGGLGTTQLRFAAALAMRGGLSEEAALAGITQNAAEVLGVGGRVGSLAPGKDADMAVLTGSPMSTSSSVMATFVNGRLAWSPALAAPVAPQGGVRRPKDSSEPAGAVVISVDELHVGDGHVLTPGEVLLVDGKVASVGRRVARPAGARVVRGAAAMPGMIDADGHHGTEGGSRSFSTRFDLTRILEPGDYADREVAKRGVTTVNLISRSLGGVTPSIAYKPAAVSSDERVVDPVAAIRVQWDAGITTLSGQNVKQLLARAKDYSNKWAKYEADMAKWTPPAPEPAKEEEADEDEEPEEKDEDEKKKKKKKERDPAKPVTGVFEGTFALNGVDGPVSARFRFDESADGSIAGSARFSLFDELCELEGSREDYDVTLTVDTPDGEWAMHLAQIYSNDPEPKGSKKKSKKDDDEDEGDKPVETYLRGEVKKAGEVAGTIDVTQTAAEYKVARRPVRIPEEKKRQRAPKGMPKKPSIDPDLEPLRRAMAGEAAVLVTVTRRDQVVACVESFAQYGIEPVLLDSSEAHTVAARIADDVAGVLVTSNRATYSADNVVRDRRVDFSSAGIPVAFASQSEEGAAELGVLAALAVARGLSPEAAVRGLTLDAARMLRIDDRVGSLEPGKDGDVIVLDGSPMEVSSSVTQVFVNGREVE
ncbi:MAG: amidohydrolase family protein [Planctomycetota bacterium]|nr:amidohydrolase family protein [Planctomycetota bacterium]